MKVIIIKNLTVSTGGKKEEKKEETLCPKQNVSIDRLKVQPQQGFHCIVFCNEILFSSIFLFSSHFIPLPSTTSTSMLP